MNERGGGASTGGACTHRLQGALERRRIPLRVAELAVVLRLHHVASEVLDARGALSAPCLLVVPVCALSALAW